MKITKVKAIPFDTPSVPDVGQRVGIEGTGQDGPRSDPRFREDVRIREAMPGPVFTGESARIVVAADAACINNRAEQGRKFGRWTNDKIKVERDVAIAGNTRSRSHANGCGAYCSMIQRIWRRGY